MLKVAVIGVMAALLAIPLKKDRQEFSMMIIMCACLIILGLALEKLSGVIEIIKQVKQYLGSGAVYVSVLLKIIGITYVAEFSSGLCKDAGYGTVGNQIEFFGKIFILAVSMPVFESLIQTISGL